MYLPLRFLEQMDNFMRIPNARHMEGYVNRKSLEWVDNLGESKVIKLFMNKDNYFNPDGSINDDEFFKLRRLIIDYQTTTGTMVSDLNDFLDQLVNSSIRNSWGKYKLAYKVDNNMVSTLSNMHIPNFFSAEVLSRVPSSCFYIDFGECCPFCEDAKGVFVHMQIDSESIDIVLVSLIDSDRVIPLTSRLGVKLDGCNLSEVQVTVNNLNAKDRVLDFEDGKKRCLKEEEYFKFFYNFLIYLQAANRDVEISETTKAVYKERKLGVIPKNKFREVKQYEVGFKYGKKIKAGQVRTVSEKSNISDGERTPRPISSHYRSAHWHHYWKGSGENKELIIKWVEGVFVKGSKESSTVVVHKVE